MTTATPSPTVLIVEDNATTLKALTLAVGTAGYTVVAAADGAAALRLLASTTPDLACLDLMLPDMDGIELARRIRDLPNGADVILIALSGLASKLDEACALSRGFSDLIFKPIEPSRLTQRLARLLPSGAAVSRPGTPNRVLLVDDDPGQRKLGQLWLTKHGFDVQTASTAREALDLAAAAPPDAIVSDLVMPDIDGLSLCRAVRLNPRLARVPYVLTSASHWTQEPNDQDNARRAGVSAFVPRTPTLSHVVDALLATLRGTSAPAPPLQAPVPDGPLYSARAIRHLEQQAQFSVTMARDAATATAQLSLLTSVAALAASAHDLVSILSEALARTLDIAGVSSGAIYLFESDGRLDLTCHIGTDDPLADSPALQRAVTEGRRTKAWAPRQDSRMAVVPIIAAGEHLGVLVLGSMQEGLDHRWLDFVATISAQLAPAVALARSITQLRESEARYRLLSERD